MTEKHKSLGLDSQQGAAAKPVAATPGVAEEPVRATMPLVGSSVTTDRSSTAGVRIGRNALTESLGDDVSRTRERHRRKRLRRLAFILLPIAAWLLLRFASGDPVTPGMPTLSPDIKSYLPGGALVILMGLSLLLPIISASRSPHVLYRPSEIDVRMSDVRGIDVVAEEVQRSLELFLLHKTFQDQMGGQPRKAILFEGPPGTGKTLMAKALAGEASVPFLFVSSSAFQSMYHGATNRKIRSYFRALRKAAREEGGAIGFIEEIDAIGAARAGMGGSGGREGIAGVVNELLIQLQSFDEPTRGARFAGWWIDKANRWLPANHQIRKRSGSASNYLVIGATNRAADLDPALLRPGRFDRSIYFDMPSRKGREEILDYYLAKKAHHPEVDAHKVGLLAASCQGYSPAMLENVLNEALVWALRRGDQKLNWDDVQRAKMAIEIGLAQPVEYTVQERRLIATHEAGHATVAYLVGRSRTLDVLSIIKRKSALGLLQHSDSDERFTQTQSEIRSFIQIGVWWPCC